MKKQNLVLVIVLVFAVVLLGGLAYYYFLSHGAPSPSLPAVKGLTVSDINNATYTINGTQAQFTDGKFHPERNGAASADQGLNAVIASSAFGDVNGDGQSDAVVVTEYGLGARDARVDALQIVLNSNGKPQAMNITIPGRTGENFATGFDAVSIDGAGLITLRLTIPTAGNNAAQYVRQYRYANRMLTESQEAQASHLKTYTDDQDGFSIQYDSSLTVNTSKEKMTIYPTDFSQDSSPTAKQLLSITSGPEQLSIAVSPDPKDVGNCMISQATGKMGPSTVKINDVAFLTYGVGDAGMGHITTYTVYHTIRNNACWSIVTTVSAVNAYMYDNPAAKASQQNKTLAAAAALIDPIVQSFKFTGPVTTASPPTCTLTSDKYQYLFGDVINLTWSSTGASRAYWYQPTEANGTMRNIVPPEGNLGLNGSAQTIASSALFLMDNPITLQVAGPGGFGACSVHVRIASSSVKPSITIDSAIVSSKSNSAGNVEVTLGGTATYGGLLDDALNLVLYNSKTPGPFDQASVYKHAFNQERSIWYSGGALVDLRYDSLPFEKWTVKTYVPAGVTEVRVLGYPMYSSSTYAATQPIVNTIIPLTPAE